MTDVRVVPYDPSYRETWDTFVARTNNGTVFHRLDFLDYHPKERFDFHHLLFFCGDELVAVLPGARDGDTYRSPAGASFGGFAAPARLPMETADAVVKALLEYCAAQGIQEVALTPPMQVYSRTFDEVFEYCMLYNRFALHNALYSSVIDLTQIRSKQDLSRNTRHKINKALNKGVKISESRDFAAFYPILLENKAKFGVRPTHTLDELERIDRLVPGMMTLFMASHDGKAVAGELLFAANDRCIINFYTMHLYEHRNLFAVNYLVEHALEWSCARGFRYYDYGVSADTFSADPMEPSRSLVRLKESMGSSGCLRGTYRKVLS